MPRGKKTRPEVENYIIHTSQKLPNLTGSEIAEMVLNKFGNEIDKTTVRKIINRNQATPPTFSSISRHSTSPEFRRHLDELKNPLLSLLEIEPLGVHDYDLAVWYSRPMDPCWPVPGGQICKENARKLRFLLTVEEKLEWFYLRQHLHGDELWDDIESLKREAAFDIESRLALFRAIIIETEKPVDQGGLGFPLDMEMKNDGPNRPAVGLAYVFAFYDQVLSRSLNLSHGAITIGAFLPISGMEHTNTFHLSNGPAISASEEDQRDRAISFMVERQETMIPLSEARASAKGYRAVETRVENVKRHIQRLRLALGFPPGSKCDGCENWVS